MGRICDLREMQPPSEPQASRTEAEMPQPPSPAALQAPAKSPQLAEANQELKSCFQADLGPASLHRAGQGRRKSGTGGAQRTTSSEPFFVVLDRQRPLDLWHLELCFCCPKPGVLTTQSISMTRYWTTV